MESEPRWRYGVVSDKHEGEGYHQQHECPGSSRVWRSRCGTVCCWSVGVGESMTYCYVRLTPHSIDLTEKAATLVSSGGSSRCDIGGSQAKCTSCDQRACLRLVLLRHVSPAAVVEGPHLRPALPTQRSDARLHSHIHFRAGRLCGRRTRPHRTLWLHLLPPLHPPLRRSVDVQNRLRRSGSDTHHTQHRVRGCGGVSTDRQAHHEAAIACVCCAVRPYFSHWHHLATDGLMSGLMTYILFWTLLYDVVYIY